jgi:integrase
VFPHGRWAWAQYRVNGQRVRKNLNIPLDDPEWRQRAAEVLKSELAKADLHRGTVVPGRLTFEQLGELLRQDYQRQGRRSLDRAERSMAQLEKRFARKRVDEIAPALDAYVDERLHAVSSGTVRLELAALKRAFTLAVKRKLVAPMDVPAFPTLAAGEPRQGFFERDDFERVVNHLPADVAGIAWLGYFTGMRRSELLALTWANVDRAAKVIRLDRTKNGRRRVLAYGRLPELVAVIEGQHESRMALGRDSAALTPWVFHRDGSPVRDFRAAWAKACKAAGVPGRLFHDLRRTAVRNLVRAGVPDVVAMSISGHRTRSVFDRYNIVNESDIADAFGRVALSHSSATKPESGSGAGSASR